MIKIEGKGGIYVQVLTDSVSPESIRHIAYEVAYPRIILSELNTHRMLSKNSASSRAIPFDKMVPTLTGRPVRFGQANPGMQDKGEDFDAPIWERLTPEAAWEEARDFATSFSGAFHKAGYAKQVFNRLTEPFQMMKTVLSGTEWNNFNWLRNDGAADPTLNELARCIKEARDESEPMLLQPGEWALPYVLGRHDHEGDYRYYIEGRVEGNDPNSNYAEWVELTLEQAQKVSAARCAAVSFRNVDYTLEKSETIFARLVGDERKHASAFEHQATPMHQWHKTGKYGLEDVNYYLAPNTWEPGITHVDRNLDLWSGNLRGWIQFRKLIPGENKEG